MNENELSDAFERALPNQPSTKGWAGQVRRRRQRHRTIIGAAAVAIVAAVAIPLGLSLDSGPQVMTTPAPTTTEQGAPLDGEAVPAPCLEAQEEHFDLGGPVDGKLPNGATRLWLCGSDTRLDHNDQLTFIGPREALTTGVDDAVEAFNDLPWQDGMIDCASSGEVYHLLIDYPDGTRRSVTGNFAPTGCQHFDTPDGIVEGADDYLETLQGLWAAQRADDERPRPDVNLCPGSTSVFTVSTADVRRGAACVVQRGDTETRIMDDLPRELLAPVLEGISADGEPLDLYEPYGSDEQVVLFNEHGDPVTLYWGQWEGASGFAWHNPQRLFWSPEEALRKRIDDYFTQVTGQPTAAPTGPAPTLGSEDDGGLTSEVCADIQSGRVQPDILPASDTLPTGAERVWLCGDLKDPFGGPLGPREPLVTDPDRVVDAINALEPGPEEEVACTAIGGLTYHLAVDYPDGSRRVISAETVNCSWVGGWGGRVGGGELLEAIEPMWFAQRADQGPPELGDPRLCDSFTSPTNWEGGYESFLNVNPTDAVRGAVCGLAGDAVGFHGEVRQVWLPQELVDAIADAEPFVEAAPQLGPRGLPYLVLMNEFGDPTTVPMLSSDQLLLPSGVWKPGEDALDLLRKSIADLRIKAFYEEPADCSKSVEGETPADLADVVSGAACVQAFAVPAKGPELEAGFAQELARRFEAESVPMSWGARSSFVVLRDAEGRHTNLYYDNRNNFDTTLPAGLVNEAGDRVWELPDDVKAELELHGFDFTQQ